VPVLEIALSRATAAQMRLHVGDRLVFFPGQNSAAVLNVPFVDQRPLALDLVGLFRVRDPEAPYWFSDSTLARPQLTSSQDLQTSNWIGTALVLPGQYRDLLRATAPFVLAYEHRFFVDPDRIHAADVDRLDGAARQMGVRYANPAALAPLLQLQLGTVLADYRSARAQAKTLLAIAAIGLLACALAVIGLLAALSNERRRTATALARGRGASPLHVLFAQGAEGLALAAPAGAAGWLAARLVIPDYPSTLSWSLVAALVAGTAALFVASIAGLARRAVGPPARDEVVVARLAPRRLVLEGLVVALALGGVYLLRRRGLASSDEGSFDAYLAGVPVLLGLAVGLVALRLYPLPLRALSVLAGRRRGIVLPLGLGRSARGHAVSSAPLLVLLLAVAVAIFSAVELTTVETEQERSAWRQVGADVRIEAAEDGRLPTSLATRLERLGATVAAAYARPAGAAGPQAPLLIALDLPAYQRVVRGTPDALRFPPALSEPTPVAIGIPAVVSPEWAIGAASLPAGGGHPISLIAVGRRESLPGVPAGTPFAVVPLPAYDAAVREATLAAVPRTRLYLRAPAGRLAAIRDVVAREAPAATVVTRDAAEQALRASPLVSSTLRGFRAAIIAAGIYAALATLLMVLISAQSRARDLAYLRTMGASERQGLALAAVELGPMAATAVALGVGVGAVVPSLIASGLRLGFFTGGSGRPPVTVPWLQPTALSLGLLALVAGCVLGTGMILRRTDLSRVLRIGEER
jgi:putative ABC transport system permease protein